MSDAVAHCPNCGAAVTFPVIIHQIVRFSRQHLVVDVDSRNIVHSCPQDAPTNPAKGTS